MRLPRFRTLIRRTAALAPPHSRINARTRASMRACHGIGSTWNGVRFLRHEQLGVPPPIWWQPVASEQISAQQQAALADRCLARQISALERQLPADFIFALYLCPLRAFRAGCRAAF